MKTLFVVAFLFVSASVQAQVTKAVVESHFTSLGFPIGSVDELYLRNTMVYYTDGTKKLTEFLYKKDAGDSFSLTDAGVKIVRNSDKSAASMLIPYDKIQLFRVVMSDGKRFLLIWLMQ